MSLCTIVGMGPGLGLSVARRFAEEKFDIAMIARNETHLQDHSKVLNEYGTKVSYAVADAGNIDKLTGALSKFSDETDVLVYNTAVIEKSSLTIDPQKLIEHLQVDVVGGLVSAQQIVPSMLGKGEGTILFTGGGFAHEPDPNYVSLSIGKAGLWNLGKMLAKKYRQYHIHVAVVSIYGKVEQGTRYDPDIIAHKFWNLHVQPESQWQKEVYIR